MKKLFTEQTLLIENGVMLEEVKARFDSLGYPCIWGYEKEDYAEDDKVSSGYLHYEDKMYFLSKKTFDKTVLSYEEFNGTVIKYKKPKSKTKKRFSENDLKEAMKFGFDRGFDEGVCIEPEVQREDFNDSGIFEDWMNDTEK